MKNKKKLEASIIIRTKNEERWIDFCLKKVFEQKDINFEVINNFYVGSISYWVLKLYKCYESTLNSCYVLPDKIPPECT